MVEKTTESVMFEGPSHLKRGGFECQIMRDSRQLPLFLTEKQ